MRFLACKIVLLSCLSLSIEASVFKGWTSHFSYRNVEKITTRSHDILAIGNSFLFSTDLHSSQFQKLSRLSGLHESLVSFTHYDRATGKTFVIYKSGAIDILNGQEIIYNRLISGSPAIKQSQVNECMVDRNIAYLSTSAGIMVLGHEDNKILYVASIVKDTAVSHVLSCAIMDGLIYAATTRGVYYAPSDANLIDSRQWKLLEDRSGTVGTISKLVYFRGAIYAYKKGVGILTFCPEKEGGYDWTNMLLDEKLLGLKLSFGHLLYFSANTVHLITPQGEAHQVGSLSSVKDVAYIEEPKAIAVAAGELGYYALVWNPELMAYKQDALGRSPTGPYWNYPWSLTADDQRLYMVAGKRTDTNRGNVAGAVMIYEQGHWNSITAAHIANSYKGKFADLIDVAIDPQDSRRYFVTSWGEGLYEFYNNQFAGLYNYANSTIEQDDFVDVKSDKVGALAFDANHNLWITNSGATVTKRIKVKLNNNTWGGFNAPPTTLPHSNWAMYNIITPTSSGVIVASYDSDYKGLSIFEPKGDFATIDPNDIKMVIPFRDIKGNIIPTIRYCSIVEDQRQEVWIGTDNGVVVLPHVADFREDYFYAYRPEVSSQDGQFVGYLLEYETINAILVAADNTKWLGTDSNGLYHVSADGSTILQHYTASNSPLVSNTILTLALVEDTHELFVGTILGLMSLDLSIVSDLPTTDTPYKGSLEPYLSVSLYPTLTTGALHYQSDDTAPLSLNVYNKLGQLCWAGQVAGNSFDLSGLPDGIYLCKFLSKSQLSSKAIPIVIRR